MEKLHIMVIGAHPDDPDYCGGLALRMIRKGHKVTYVSVTDGGAGHHEMNEKESAFVDGETNKIFSAILDN